MHARTLIAATLFVSGSLAAQTPTDSSREPQALGAVNVSAERPVIAEFEERRLAGFGHFITRAELEKQANRRTSDILARVPGLSVKRGTGGYAWIASSRGNIKIEENPRPSALDLQRGARPACYSNVYVDGAIVYTSGMGDLFDINQIGPDQIEAIEFYSGGAQVPSRFNRTNSACGVLVVWTRR